MATKKTTDKTIATNRKAYHNYFIQDGIEAGIALTGAEIKSIRAGRVNMSDAYIKPERGELWLVNAHIARYEAGSAFGQEPTRERKLLLHRKQITGLTGKVAERGLTIVPLKIYLKGNLAKVEVALAKGKKQYDKRESITRRETERDLRRVVKNGRKSGRAAFA
ncbi:MAG: SsrA-binding protein SmpB [Chloroflexi bacterium]|nr:SsrA-binding protein SmpB [Chloroflexota bacterium]